MRDPSIRLPWHVPLIFALTFVVHYLDRNLIAFALPRMAQELQWSDRQVGEYGQYLLGAFFLSYGLAQLLLSGVAERFGAKRSLVLAQQESRTQLGARRAQLARESEGQLASLTEQRAQGALVKQQTAQLEDLARQGYYPRLKLADAQRQLHASQQEEARSLAEIARLQEATREANAALAHQGAEARRDWQAELLEAERQGDQLAARATALEQQIQQARLVAPVDGVVVALAVHTVGGVVQAGQTLLELVPSNDELVVESRFALQAGEKLRAGQPADLVFTSLDRTRTPLLHGQVLTVSADKLDDTRNGASYLRVRVALPPAERARLEGVELRAGLPVDVMVKLGERSLLAWWLKPLSDRLGRTFSEA